MTSIGPWLQDAAKALTLLCLACTAQAQDKRVEGMAKVLTNQLGALTRASPRGRLEPVDVYFRDAAIRIDFQDARGKSYSMLLPEHGQAGWIVHGQSGALPIPRAQPPLVFDVQKPCAGRGMFADCKRLGDGLYAGRQAVHWRYRLTSNTGPGRTSRGDMWLDADTGLVLAYKGETGVGLPQEWRVITVDYTPVPASLFEVPEQGLRGAPVPPE